MKNLLLYTILGLGSGGVYAILGLGLVLIYKGSGVVNFAQGAIGVAACYVYLELGDVGMPRYLACAATLLFAMLFGAAIHWTIFGRLRSAPVLAKLVATLGLLLTLQGIVEVIFGDSPKISKPLLPQGPVHLLSVTFAQDRLWLFGLSLVLGCLLWISYRFTRFGLVTRAAAESEKGAALLGYSPDAVAALNWALGCGLAAVAGILIAPITSLSPTAFTLLILPALAAAVVGRFTSFGLVTLAGCAIGVLASLVTGGVVRVWPSVIPPIGLSDSLPFVVIIIALVVGGRLPARGNLSEGRFPYAPRPRHGRGRARWAYVAIGVGGAVLLTALYHSDRPYQSAIATGVISAMVGLSVVVISGLGGQISLAQLTFAGVGAFAAAKLSSTLGIPFLPTLVLSGLVAVPIGVLIGLPALRIRGVNLAVVSLGAAVTIESVLFQNPRWGGGIVGLTVAAPTIFGWSLNPNLHPERFALVAACVLALTYISLVKLRIGAFGKQILAVRNNERAAAGYGVNVGRTKLAAFALASFIAGMAGALYGYQNGSISFDAFSPLQSIFFFSLVYIASIASLGGGLLVGVIATGGITWTFINHIGALTRWQDLISGLALLLTVIRNPDGVVVGFPREVRRVATKLRRHSQRAAPAGGQPTTGDDAPDPVEAAMSSKEAQ